MIKLTIDNSTSNISGLNQKQTDQLRDLLSYDLTPNSAYFSGAYSTKRYLLSKRGDFPSGLLPLVTRYLGSIPYQTYAVSDLRVLPEPLPGLFTLNLSYAPYPEQLVAAEACREHGRGIIVAPTGLGKSVIAALIIEKLQVPTLIVVPTLELKRQLTESLRECFGYNVVGGLSHMIAVENVDALDPNKLLVGYNCVIIDEFHHSAAKTYRKLNTKAWKNVYHRFGMTATAFRSKDEEKLLLESVLSEVIYEVNYQTAVYKRYIVPMEAYYIDLPKQTVKGETWAQVYNELVVNNSHRNDIIVGILECAPKQLGPTLCLVKEIAHGNKISVKSKVSFANGQSSDCTDLIKGFNNGQLMSLIGTTGVLGEGVDSRPAELIIIAGLGKSKNAFMQQCGRGFRRYPGKESCKIILFRDPSHKWTIKHFNAQKKYLLEEYGVVPVKICT